MSIKANEIAENIKLQKQNRKMMNENERIEFDDKKVQISFCFNNKLNIINIVN